MNNHSNKFLNFAGILLVLVILSVYPISKLYARYTTSDDNNDIAVVAKFEVNEQFETSNTFPIKIKPGDKVERIIIVENKSDVSISVEVTVENVTNNLPLTFECNIIEIDSHSSGEVVVYVSWSELSNSTDYTEMVDVIKFNLTAKQID